MTFARLVNLCDERKPVRARGAAKWSATRRVQGDAWPARVVSADLTDVTPTEYRADLVISLGDTAQRLTIVVETQLRPDLKKRRTWPVYLTTSRARDTCLTYLLVIAPDAPVAEWCRQPIVLGPCGSVVRPIVIQWATVPITTNLAQAITSPELAVLSAMAHGKDPCALEVAWAALAAVARLDDDRVRLYTGLIYEPLNAVNRRALEEQMTIPNYV